jgi:Ca-activated chloride channel homolog
MKFLLFGLFCFLIVSSLQAQTLRGLKQQATEAYDRGEYGIAYDQFTQALDKKKEWTTLYNLSNTHYQLQEYQRASQGYLELLEEEMEDAFRANIYHNLGNCYFQMNALDESFEAYKKALLLSPDDHDTKMNLSKVIRMRQQQEANPEQQEGNSEQKEEENSEQKEEENSEQKEEENSEQRDDPNGEKGDDQKSKEEEKESSDGTQQEDQGEQGADGKQEGLVEKERLMSKEQAEQLLKIIEEEERKVLERLRTIPSSGKKSEKDW